MTTIRERSNAPSRVQLAHRQLGPLLDGRRRVARRRTRGSGPSPGRLGAGQEAPGLEVERLARDQRVRPDRDGRQVVGVRPLGHPRAAAAASASSAAASRRSAADAGRAAAATAARVVAAGRRSRPHRRDGADDRARSRPTRATVPAKRDGRVASSPAARPSDRHARRRRSTTAARRALAVLHPAGEPHRRAPRSRCRRPRRAPARGGRDDAPGRAGARRMQRRRERERRAPSAPTSRALSRR